MVKSLPPKIISRLARSQQCVMKISFFALFLLIPVFVVATEPNTSKKSLMPATQITGALDVNMTP